MKQLSRRAFINLAGLGAAPLLSPATGMATIMNEHPAKDKDEAPCVNLISVGAMLTPGEYIDRLNAIRHRASIEPDNFGEGGIVATLEKQFQELTGMERAIFLPTGTMANQLAIRLLSGDLAKVVVQETSHVFRDESDAAQVVHGKRLIPLAPGKSYFTVAELGEQLHYLKEAELFATSIGAVSLETPVRRCDITMIPFNELKSISHYCRQQKIPLHIDGARILMAAVWSDRSVREYASLADTMYISLYKYLGASSGAILCGKKELIDKVPSLVKLYGGSMYQNWTNAAIASDHLTGFEERLRSARKKGEELISALNTLEGISITPRLNGTSNYKMDLTVKDTGKFRKILADTGIRLGRTSFTINETILNRPNDELVQLFKKAISA